MYSMVLMMALTTGGEMPAFCRGCRACGCYTCACYACGCFGCRGWCGCRGWSGCYSCGSYTCGCYSCGWYAFGHCGGLVIYGCHACGCGVAPAAPARPHPAPPPAKAAGAPTPATIVVSLPADATLTIDGSPTKSTDATRVFTTPALDPNGSYTYTFQAQVVRDGQTLTLSKKVAVRGGQETRVSFEFPLVSVAAK
ncbi:MAG: TIGR03000 domain-containing protein [Gemmataceae bacterium]|nr:TIGR03000 domain-containing protein [Gemmataceae bacterium]MDW8264697.1 TIGR03000 domain-containing protein [Gemmataceae bacterium]